MNKKSTSIIFFFGLLLTGIVFACRNKPKEITAKVPGQALYAKYCADCHGKNLETFASKKDWLFGSEEGDLITSIKFGREIVGMPAYEKTFTDQEIKNITNYIISNKGISPIPSTARNFERSEKQKINVTQVVEDNKYGELLWGIDFVPNGNMLLTDKTGALHFGMPGEKLSKIEGMPDDIKQLGQSGLMDVMVHPNYLKNNFIYLSFTEEKPNNGAKKQLVVIRAILDEENLLLKSKQEIFRAIPAVLPTHHLGARMVIDKNGYLFIASGERGSNEQVQELSNHFGKMIRLHDDGRIPKDNPFINTEGALPEIYTLGHRNPQGLVVHPETNAIYAHEHGPKGGDEINLIEAGKNYGWPTILFGIDYDGRPISKDTAKAGMEQPLHYWLPSIAPCGMEYIPGNQYPGWKGNLLIGSLKFQYVARCIILENGKIKETEKLLEGIGRVRSVKADPNGILYVVTEKPGAVHRIAPLSSTYYH